MGDNGSNNGGDVGGDTRWMTYAELAEARGTKEPAAVRLVQRRGWKRQMGNDGSARIAVPVPALRPSKTVAPDSTRVGGDRRGEAEAALSRERARADQAEARAERAEARADDARAAAERAGLERQDALVRAAAAEGEATALRDALREARRPAWRRWLGID